MTLPRPPWEFRDQHDKRKFKAWINQQLDAFDEPIADDIWREAHIANDEASVTAMEREYGRQRQRGWVLRAARQLQRGTMSRAERKKALQALRQLPTKERNRALQALGQLSWAERNRELQALRQLPAKERNRALQALGQLAAKERNRVLQGLRRLMANDQELTTVALQELTNHHEHGREPGDPRPRDLSDVQRVVRQDALAELDYIREIMMHHYRRYRGSELIALEVAAERAGISPDDLISFRKNQPRHFAS